MHGDDERVQARIEARMRVLPRAHDDDAGRPAGVQAAVAVEPAGPADERPHDDAQEAAERDPPRGTPGRTAPGGAPRAPAPGGRPRPAAWCPPRWGARRAAQYTAGPPG